MVIKYDYSQENLSQLNAILSKKLSQNDQIKTFTDLITIFSTSVDEACKLKVIKFWKRNRIVNPWIKTALINSISSEIAYIKFGRRPQQNFGDPRLFEEYRRYRNKLSLLIKTAKQQHYLHKLLNSTGNLKQTWATINELWGKSKASASSFFTINNTVLADKKSIANKFNNYFRNVAATLIEDILKHHIGSENFTKFLPKSEQSSLFLNDTEVNEVIDIIKKFSNDKSSDFPIVVVKHCAQIIAPTLSRLHNSCMLSGSFPDELKFGIITPVYKKGQKDKIENYTPISTLPIFDKIFEKLPYSRIYDFMIERKIICETQFGFRKHHSTSHAIYHSLNFIKECHALKKHVIGIFIDLSKAFDTINHNTLLHKLYNYGIRRITHNLIRSYLSNRFQCVKIDDTKSEQLSVQYGVPQGSIRGPLLFLSYINDLKNVVKIEGTEIILYSDDTNIFIACNTLSKANQVSNEILSCVQEYMYSNLLHINLDKSSFMYFPPSCKYLKTDTSRKKSQDPVFETTGKSVSIDNIPVKEVTEVRFLGVVLDPLLDRKAIGN